MSQPTKVRQLIAGSWKAYRAKFRVLGAIVVTVALPAGLLTLAGADTVVSAYASLATLIMNLAVIWAIVRLSRGESVSVKQAYYQGTAGVVRFLITSVALGALLLPLALGGLLFNSAAGGASSASIGTPERVLVGLLWAILALPSLYWLTSRLFALMIVAEGESTPLAALRESRQLVKGRAWAVFGRLTALAGIIVFIIMVPTILLVVAGSAAVLNYGLAILQLAVSLTLLPWSYIYLHKLYRSLL